MDASRAIEIGTDIASRFRGWGSGDWTELLTSDQYGSDWAKDLLGRIVALVGESPIVYGSGYFDEDGDISGSVTVFTNSSVIQSVFRAERGTGIHLAEDTIVSARPRSDISSVSVGRVDFRAAPEWPRKPVATLTFNDGSILTLPNAKYMGTANYDGLAAFIPTLVAGLT